MNRKRQMMGILFFYMAMLFFCDPLNAKADAEGDWEYSGTDEITIDFMGSGIH